MACRRLWENKPSSLPIPSVLSAEQRPHLTTGGSTGLQLGDAEASQRPHPHCSSRTCGEKWKYQTTLQPRLYMRPPCSEEGTGTLPLWRLVTGLLVPKFQTSTVTSKKSVRFSGLKLAHGACHWNDSCTGSLGTTAHSVLNHVSFQVELAYVPPSNLKKEKF